jgi:N-methylhydantoinase B
MAASVKSRLDPITFELIHSGLLSAAEEMGGILKRSSFSPVIREMEDFSCAIFDAQGTLVAQADYIPAQLGAMSLVVQSTLARWQNRLEPGDVFIANDPYSGCMHTPDLNVVMPIFIGKRLFAWAGTTAHHIDVGGVNPGTEGPGLHELYAEGLILPPVKLVNAGVEAEDLFTLISANIRSASATIADLRAQRAACDVGRRRLEETVDRYGTSAVSAAFERSLDEAEQAASATLKEMPDGEAEAEGFLDDDGCGGPPTRIHARVQKKGGRILIDLSGSADQIPGALNVPWASTRATALFLVRAFTNPDQVTNDGILRVMDLICPVGSVLRPRPPAAVSVRHNTSQRLADTLVRAASQIWPERAVASSTVTFFCVNLQTVSPRSGITTVMMDVVGGGTGASRGGDGLDGVDTYMANVGLLPVEVAETEYSMSILRTELVPGSQGLGQRNGGLGIRREYEVLGTRQVATIYGEQTKPDFYPRGCLGGGGGAPTKITVVAPDGTIISTPSKVTLTLDPGSVFRVETSGGGGFGSIEQRSHEDRQRDLDDGLVEDG